ncbi:MAG: hypothetical protein NZ772_02025 [Cyanobacteria bacterium]|nr:hypothetical protein [Cyanobacteriota bacterium]MDW8200275.1 hypothetical protein [Cyanobacteriota bacterium SKYGB_h_bin112]
MEIILAVFSAISAISTITLAVLLFQTQTSLNANTKKQADASANISKQIERLVQRNQALEQKLSEWLDAQSKSSDKVCETLYSSGEMQVKQLQLVANKLEALKNSLEESINF